MTTIRPNLPPTFPPAGAAKSAESAKTESAKSAAARAFFELAAGRAPAAAAPAAMAASAAEIRAAAPVQRTVQAPAEPPTRPLRPGSLLDIRV